MPKVSPTYRDRSVCIVGLGYVGLTLATVMAECGFDVYGVEVREDVVDMLREGKAHFHEPGLSERLTKLVQQQRIKVSLSIPSGCPATVFIITVGTPLDARGQCRLDMIERVTGELARHLKDDDMVLLRSTVKLGVTRGTVAARLGQTGKRFQVAFCPERTVEGRALAELRMLPQIVAGLTDEACTRAAHLFNHITPTVVQVSSVEVAEMIKLISNSHRDVSFAFANEVARICDAAGLNAIEVIDAGKLSYPRTNLPLPGPVGGPCLEKDPHILAESVARFGVKPEIVLAGRVINERQPAETVSQLRTITHQLSGFSHSPRISLVGLAFKGRPETDDLRGTMALPIARELRRQFEAAELRCYDPVVPADRIRENFQAEPLNSLAESFRDADVVVIANNHPMFESMPVAEFAAAMKRPAVIYDYWNNFDSRDVTMPEGTYYFGLGTIGSTLPNDGRIQLGDAGSKGWKSA